MKPEFTEQQSLVGLNRSEQLSLNATLPPAEIPGFQVERLLGQGAFGQVWLGRDLNTGRQVAIKFYLHCGGVNWSLLRQEVKHLVNMSTGRYIVQVLGVGWEAQPPYYVMEYLENGSLQDQIRERGTFTVSETVSMFREIADGLSYSHGKGVLHCDLKPANVLLDHDLRPRLADFGQSRMSDDQTPSLGTLFFMAPEQADLQASPDAAWDVYALGAIAYTMLVGSPPYRNAEAVEKLDSAASLPERLGRYQATLRYAQRPRLHYRRRGADKSLCQIIDRCLAPEPAQRYRNIQQVIAAIDSRNQARSRRPLVWMGILGPLLLLSLMLWFSNFSISLAKQESLEQVLELSLRGNLQTAKYAKSTMESEIKSLFQLVQREASLPELANLLVDAMRPNEQTLTNIAARSIPEAAPAAFLNSPERMQLNQFLQGRIQAILAKEGNGGGVAIFNSLFLNDARGTNMGIAFADPQEELAESPIGRNFAYRSYFNGQREDGDKRAPASDFAPTRYPHLSASFRSTSTGKWKLGISAPIWPLVQAELVDAGNAPDPRVKPLGVLVLTVNLGDFVLLSDVANGDTQFTTLVDGRSGNQRGTLLQHPLIQAMDRKTMVGSLMPQMSEKQLERLLSSDGIVDYVDPAASFPNGEKFSGTWIAALAQVHLPHLAVPIEKAELDPESNSSDLRRASDLWVLVQEKSSIVSAPVNELGSRLQRVSLKALGAILLLMVALWFVVFRAGNSLLKYLVPSLKFNKANGLLSKAADSSLESTIRSDR